MPPSRVSRVGRIVENSDPQRFAIDYTSKICPIRAFTPDLFFPVAALGVLHHAGALRLGRSVWSRFLQCGGQSHREGAFLGVAEGDLLARRQRNIEVDGAELLPRVKGHPPRLPQQRLARRVLPYKRS